MFENYITELFVFIDDFYKMYEAQKIQSEIAQGNKIRQPTRAGGFGFKLHLVIDLSGNLMAVTLTPANQNDRRPVEMLLQNFKGTVCGDKGYISKELAQRLAEKGIKLVTGIKKGMENKLMGIKDKVLLKKRSLIESVIGKLKRCLSLERSRHRSVKNFCCHIIAALIAYQLAENKPHTTLENALSNP